MKVIKLYAKGDVRTIEMPSSYEVGWLAKQIGCEYIERVQPRNYPDWSLIVDEQGLYNANPVLNVLASVMYGTHEHGAPIVGNALLMKTAWTSGGYDLVGLTDEEVEEAYKMLDKVFLIAKGWEMKVRREQRDKQTHD